MTGRQYQHHFIVMATFDEDGNNIEWVIDEETCGNKFDGHPIFDTQSGDWLDDQSEVAFRNLPGESVLAYRDLAHRLGFLTEHTLESARTLYEKDPPDGSH